MVVALLVALGAAGGDAVAGKRHRRSNMPEGWQWPPSPAMKRAGERCLADLDEAGIVWKPAAKERAIATPVEIPGMELGGVKLSPTYRKGPFTMDCHLALALHKMGEVLRQVGVAELRFSTIHEYRRIRMRGRHSHALSRHALGLAIDVFEVVTDAGEKVVVKDDYRHGEPTLLAIERGITASLDFRRPLTPKSSPRSHRDHFHLEARVDYTEDRSRTASLW
ncbi:MAG TPA: extensin family protein [Kofleriaceae bacterium]|nr:extensin family protein [Kofleriaceae bacterium]